MADGKGHFYGGDLNTGHMDAPAVGGMSGGGGSSDYGSPAPQVTPVPKTTVPQKLSNGKGVFTPTPTNGMNSGLKEITQQDASLGDAAGKVQGDIRKRQIASDPFSKLHGYSDQEISEAQNFAHNEKKYNNPMAADHRDSVLADPFNVIHYGQDEVDRAVQDSSNVAQNIQALKDSPASGSENIQAKPIGKARFPNFGK